MHRDIMFFQSTNIGSGGQTGLFDLLLHHINSLENVGVFDIIQIIVPNHAMAAWLKDKVTLAAGICANLDFVVLPGPVIENVYKLNNPNAEMFDLKQVKYIIYQYICRNKIDTPDASELNHYIYNDNQIDKFRAYQLASQLQQIIHEYIYLRTSELINLEQAKFPLWQKQIIRHLIEAMADLKSFLDIYSFFAQYPADKLALPPRLFIFGLTSIYPSQLKIIKKIATVCDIYWYYQPCSHEYYGDLLSDYAKSRLQNKFLNEPELCLDDLYLTDGNPLLANLGQQSREFIELLQANDITVYDFKPEQITCEANTMLSIIQEDIRQIKYRIKPEYRIYANDQYYAEPKNFFNSDDFLFDLPHQQLSIKFNSCHNRMREVQVMFNELVNVLNSNPEVKLTDILICAPDIDDYEAYIAAVFDNEVVGNKNGKEFKLLYNITGNRRHQDFKTLDNIKLILNTPYNLNVNYFIEILTQIGFNHDDIEQVKFWLAENAIHFGYTADDYIQYGYVDYPVYSFKHWLNNLVLGACLSEALFEPGFPLFQNNCPYDNLDSKQVELCNKLISLICLLEDLRSLVYIDENTYSDLSITTVHDALNKLHNYLATINQESNGIKFIGAFLGLSLDVSINLPILVAMIEEFTADFSSKININGAITCASMSYMRNIPFKYIYILGLNFGEFPEVRNPNQLSVLAKEWHLADRNYNIEDKQVFLDTILSASTALYMSYIGRKETDNSEIKPSPLLSQFINTLGQSFTNFWYNNEAMKFNFKNVICQQSLHPFYNNQQLNFSLLWHQVSMHANDKFTDKRWDFRLLSPLKQQSLNPSLKNIINTFLYTNSNLYQMLGINHFSNEVELEDIESLELISRQLAVKIYPYLEKYNGHQDGLYEYLTAKGIISYGNLGLTQFNYYSSLYKRYSEIRGNQFAQINLQYALPRANSFIDINISGEVIIDGESIIIMPAFPDIRSLAEKFSDIPYSLKVTAMVVYLLLFNGAHISVSQKITTVLIRQLDKQGNSRDFKISIADITIINSILAYYLRSCANPVLIHKGAINDYIISTKTTFPDGSLRFSREQKLSKAMKIYSADFNNFDLEKIREDIIFGSIADNYFEVIQQTGGVNDIISIGEILAKVEGEMI